MRRSHFLGSLLSGRRRHLLASFLLGSGLILGAAKASAHPPATPRDGAATQQLQAWQDLLIRSRSLDDSEKLQVVNRFFNQRIRYGEDQDLWGLFDYWAAPQETLERGAGDCEDFALAKYFTLLLLGIPEQRLRLVYTTLSATRQAHMVLGYWPENGEVAVLLDNLSPEILPFAQRQDLQMQFAFGADHLYRFDHGHLITVGDAALLPNWHELQAKVSLEALPPAEPVRLAAAPSLRKKREG